LKLGQYCCTAIILGRRLYGLRKSVARPQRHRQCTSAMREKTLPRATNQPARKKIIIEIQYLISDRDLGADFHDASGRDLEEVGGVRGALGEADEQPVLPARH